MSVLKQMMDIQSPRRNNPIEIIEGEKQPCGYCSGNGFFWGRDEYGEGVKKTCPLCNGTKYVQPEIAITWKPVNNK
jgi:DnaJ-class molecular chaperone